MAIEEEKEEAPVEVKPKSKKTLFVALAVVGLLLVIGVPAFFFFKAAPVKSAEELPADAAQESPQNEGLKPEGSGDDYELQEGEERLGAIMPLDTFVINLSAGRYVRLQAQLEFETLDIPNKYYAKEVPIRDSIITVLGQHTADELLGEKGRDKLRDEIKETVNGVLHKQEVKHVYFTQFVIP